MAHPAPTRSEIEARAHDFSIKPKQTARIAAQKAAHDNGRKTRAEKQGSKRKGKGQGKVGKQPMFELNVDKLTCFVASGDVLLFKTAGLLQKVKLEWLYYSKCISVFSIPLNIPNFLVVFLILTPAPACNVLR